MDKLPENQTGDFPEVALVPAPHPSDSEEAELDSATKKAPVNLPKSYLTLDPPPPQSR